MCRRFVGNFAISPTQSPTRHLRGNVLNFGFLTSLKYEKYTFVLIEHCCLTTVHVTNARAMPRVAADVGAVTVGPHGAPGFPVLGAVQGAAIVRSIIPDEGKDAPGSDSRSRVSSAPSAQSVFKCVEICQKSLRIGCVIPRCKLQCEITQPILRLF